jgi:phosphatidylserine decarboxylase
VTVLSQIARIFEQEDINFLLTNLVPRRFLTLFVGWFSKIEQPLIRDASMRLWRLFSALDLGEAKRSHFHSIHDCFIRELKEGARPIDCDPNVLTSPCDGIVGACGTIANTDLYQIKGSPYSLHDLLGDDALVQAHRNGRFVTLRLTPSMYHRFHAPHDCRITRVTYISGDTWNVNPIALRRVEKLFCKNERAVIETTLADTGYAITLVPVAAILVASIRLNFLNVLLHLRYRGRNIMPCNAVLNKGDEMGWFEHGSTMIVFASDGFSLCEGVTEGATIRANEALMRLP